jgi:hypothetical protein
MNVAEHFEIGKEFATFRPVGRASLAEGARIVSEGIALARQREQRKLLLDISRLTGVEPPSVTARYWFIREWAEVAGGRVRVIAFVIPPELIDEQKFGVTVARNLGLICDVFTSEADAVAWLRAQP